MIGKWIKGFTTNRSEAEEPVQASSRVSVLDVAIRASHRALEKNPLPDIMGQDFMTQQAEELLGYIDAIDAADDQVAMERYYLGSAVANYAAFKVLMLDPPPSEDPIGLFGTGGVTGQLKALIPLLAVKHDGLAVWLGRMSDADDFETQWAAIRVGYLLAEWKLEALGGARVALRDFNPVHAEDWYLPFIRAECVRQEWEYRQALQMPSAFADDPGGAEPRRYAAFASFVSEGHRFPDKAWEANFPKA